MSAVFFNSLSNKLKDTSEPFIILSFFILYKRSFVFKYLVVFITKLSEFELNMYDLCGVGIKIFDS